MFFVLVAAPLAVMGLRHVGSVLKLAKNYKNSGKFEEENKKHKQFVDARVSFTRDEFERLGDTDDVREFRNILTDGLERGETDEAYERVMKGRHVR